ncbi:MAG: hypothetical protein AB1629_06480 [Candidatus Omnitrophota bacterium]
MAKEIKKKAKVKLAKKKQSRRRVIQKRTTKKRSTKNIRKRSTKKILKTAAKILDISGELLGEISHFYPKVSAAVLTLKRGELKLGDRIRVVGHSTDFEQEVGSMQIDHQAIPLAKKGDEIGLEVKARVRQNDKVYKIA